ncbi:MAG: hypothetical protein KAJ10_07280 [Thermodesulfovibrionia bacterium]|nr:hypothetical protein [Thermodesulfovibrionia bacterium]
MKQTELKVGNRASFDSGGMEYTGSICGFLSKAGNTLVLLDVAGFGKMRLLAERLHPAD